MKTAYEIARLHLDKLPSAVSGAGGHNRTFTAACWLVKCGLSDSQAMELLHEYNRRCQPPWTEKELWHKLTDARRVVTQRLKLTPAPPVSVRVVWKVTPTVRPKPEVVQQPVPAHSVDEMFACETPTCSTSKADDDQTKARSSTGTPENAPDDRRFSLRPGDLVPEPFADVLRRGKHCPPGLRFPPPKPKMLGWTQEGTPIYQTRPPAT
jgi:hypothetical protein